MIQPPALRPAQKPRPEGIETESADGNAGAHVGPAQKPRPEGIETCSSTLATITPPFCRPRSPDQRGFRRGGIVLIVRAFACRPRSPDQRGLRRCRPASGPFPSPSRPRSPDQRGLRRCFGIFFCCFHLWPAQKPRPEGIETVFWWPFRRTV